MPLPTINDVQAVDPVLTNLLVGYMQSDSRFVASRVFPVVPVDKDSGTYFIFTKKYWFVDELEQRAPGAIYAAGGFGVSSTTYTTIQYAKEYIIADETRANSQIPMDLERVGVMWLGQQSLIRKERGFAADFMVTGVWGTDVAGSTDFTKWSDYAASDPVANIRTAKRTISTNTGQNANTMVCGEIVEDRLANHPDLIDRLKYTQSATDGTVRGALAAIFGLERLDVSTAVYNSANTGASASMAAIIDDDALVCYSPGSASLMTPCAGKTFVWGPGGGAGSIKMDRRSNRDADAVMHKEQWDQASVATDVGYFLSDCVD